MGYLAAKLSSQDREQLLQLFPAKNPDLIADHVTLIFPFAPTDSNQFSSSVNCSIIGYVSEDHLEAFVVTIDQSPTRLDGKRYHITWSLNRAAGKKPVDSNKLIEKGEIQVVDPVINLTLPVQYCQ